MVGYPLVVLFMYVWGVDGLSLLLLLSFSIFLFCLARVVRRVEA